MKIGDLVRVTKRYDIVELGVIIDVGPAEIHYPRESYDIWCMDSQRVCSADGVDVEPVNESR